MAPGGKIMENCLRSSWILKFWKLGGLLGFDYDSQFQLTHVWRIEHCHLILASRHEIGGVRLVRSCCRSTCWHGCFLLIPQKRSTGESWRPSVLETPWPPTAGHETTTALHATCEILSEFLKKTVLLEKSLHQIWRVRIDSINFLSQLCDSSSRKTGFAVEVSSRALLQTDIAQGTSEIPAKFLGSHEWWAKLHLC